MKNETFFNLSILNFESNEINRNRKRNESGKYRCGFILTRPRLMLRWECVCGYILSPKSSITYNFNIIFNFGENDYLQIVNIRCVSYLIYWLQCFARRTMRCRSDTVRVAPWLARYPPKAGFAAGIIIYLKIT